MCKNIKSLRELMHKKDFYLLYKRENELFEMYHYTRVIITAILILHVPRLFYKIIRIRIR